MKEPTIIFFCGPHCSGKSSILDSLYKEGIFSALGNEIGKDLFYQRGFETARQDEQFEFEVSRRELERDVIYASRQGIIGIESWHPGNLAYAMVRNPDSVSRLVSYMISSPLLSNAYGIRLSVSPETIFSRTETFRDNRSWAADFYSKIDGCLDFCLTQLGLQERSISINADKDFSTVIKEVKDAIQTFRFPKS